MTAFLILCFIAGVLYGCFHAGHGAANYRHSRAVGNARRPSLYIGARGPWVSIPGPFGTRIGRRL